MQLVGEMTDHFLHALIATQQDVIAQHCRYRDRETDRRHDQGLADGARNGFEQVREVFTLITGKEDLDLYKKR